MFREATARASESPVVGGPSAPRTGPSPEALADSRTMNTDTPSAYERTDSSIDDHHRCGRGVAR